MNKTDFGQKIQFCLEIIRNDKSSLGKTLLNMAIKKSIKKKSTTNQFSPEWSRIEENCFSCNLVKIKIIQKSIVPYFNRK